MYKIYVSFEYVNTESKSLVSTLANNFNQDDYELNVKLKIEEEYKDLVHAGKLFVYSTRFSPPSPQHQFPAVPIHRLYL